MTAVVRHPRPALGYGAAAALLAMLMGLQPATTDTYLPALPLLTQDLAAPMTLAQMTLSALILAFGIGQLVWGPVADRIGRRPVLLGTLAAYTAASIGGALAADITQLVVWRTLQGFVLAGPVVCARAMVRDLYEPVQGAQVMALALSGLGVVAIGGPLLGGLVTGIGGWRMALLTVALFGALALALIAWRLPETLARKNPQATALRPMLATWRQIGRHPGFRAWMLLITCTYGALFSYLAGSSFVFMDVLGLSPGAYGVAVASVSGSFLVGTFACRPLIRRCGLRGAVARGSAFALAAGLLSIGLAFAGVVSLWALLVPMCLFCFSHGINMPCAQTGAVGPFPRAAGAASALAGFVMALVAFGISQWLAVALDGSTAPLAYTFGALSLATCAVGWSVVRRHGDLA